MEKKHVKIKHKATEMLFSLTNEGCIDMKMVKKIWPGATALTYDKDGQKAAAVFINEDYIQANDTITIYDVFIPSPTDIVSNNQSQSTDRKRRLHEDMLDDLLKLDESIDKKSKLANKKCEKKNSIDNQDLEKKKNICTPTAKAFQKRIVHITWKHRTFNDIAYKVEEKQVIKDMDHSINYSFEEVRSKLLGAFTSDSAKFHFETCETQIAVGNNIKVITDFCDEEGTPQLFWDFCKPYRDSSRKITFFLLTTLCDSTKPKPSMIAEKETLFRNNQKKNSFTDVSKSAKSSSHDVASIHDVVYNVDSDEEVKVSNEENDSFQHYQKSFKKQYEPPIRVQKKLPVLHSAINKENLISNNPKNVSESMQSPTKFTSSIQQNQFMFTSSVDNTLSKNYLFKSFEQKDSFNKQSSAMQSVTNTSEMVSDYSDASSINSPIKLTSVSKKSKAPSSFSFKAPVLPLLHKTSMQQKSQSVALMSEKLKSYGISLLKIEETDFIITPQTLGKGAQGVVRKGLWNGTDVAIKTISKIKFEKLLFREIAIMEKIRHENFINIMAICPAPTEFHIVMEYCDGKSLGQMIFDFPQTLVNLFTKNKIGLQFCKGITFIHSLKEPIIHRDIKPSNVLVDSQYNVKICDYGISKCKDLSSRLQTSVVGRIRGTIAYLSPEILLPKIPEEASIKSDVWALALTLIELYSYQASYEIEGWDIFGCLRDNFSKEQLPNLHDVPVFLRKEIKNCLNFNPIKRHDSKDLLKQFQSNSQLEAVYLKKFSEFSNFDAIFS